MTGAIGGLFDKHNKTGEIGIFSVNRRYFQSFMYPSRCRMLSDKPGHNFDKHNITGAIGGLFDKHNGTFDKHNITGGIGGIVEVGGNVTGGIGGIFDKHNKTGRMRSTNRENVLVNYE